MAEYDVSLASSAAKELHNLPDKVIARIVAQLENLAITPQPHGCKKLKGGDAEYRIRTGDYRVIYELDNKKKTVFVTCIAHRREVYR